jgi:hypothetical protein
MFYGSSLFGIEAGKFFGELFFVVGFGICHLHKTKLKKIGERKMFVDKILRGVIRSEVEG